MATDGREGGWSHCACLSNNAKLHPPPVALPPPFPVLFKQYDFNSNGSISKDEMVMMHSSLVSGCCKLDNKVGAVCEPVRVRKFA